MSYKFRQITPNQKRFVYAERFSDFSYIIPTAQRIEGPLDVTRLESAVRTAFDRHDALKTDFVLVAGSYRARVHDKSQISFHTVDLTDLSLKSLRKAALSLIFDTVNLSDLRSLNRVIVGKKSNTEWMLCTAIHHALSDGISRSHLLNEIYALYGGDVLPPAGSYYDLFQSLNPAAVESDKKFWKQWGHSSLPHSELPPDFRHRNDQDDGDAVEIKLSLSVSDIRKIASAQRTSTFGVLSAAYAISQEKRPLRAFIEAENLNINRRDPIDRRL